MVHLGAEYLSPKKVNLLNYNRFFISPKRLKVTYSAPKYMFRASGAGGFAVRVMQDVAGLHGFGAVLVVHCWTRQDTTRQDPHSKLGELS